MLANNRRIIIPPIFFLVFAFAAEGASSCQA